MIQSHLYLGLLFIWTVVNANVDPNRLKPCFEKYGYHKLAEATPFHSDGGMLNVDSCLVFCAKTTSRCRSIVYDRMTQSCHYFMIDGVELRRVVPSGRMDYFQLADANCAANVIESSFEPSETVEPEIVSPTSVEENGEKIPLIFAPEKFPQPPEATTLSTTEAPTTTQENLDGGVDIDADPDLGDEQPTETIGIHPAGRKPSPKFDVKLEKNGFDETIIYDDRGDVARYVTHRPQIGGKLSDVRVPSDVDDVDPNDDDDKEVISDDGEAIETIVTPENNEDYTETPQKAEGQEYDEPEVTVSATTEVAPTVEMPTTIDPRDDELKKLQEQLELLEHQMREVQKTTIAPYPDTVLPQLTKPTFKPIFPKLPPTPAELMNRMPLPDMVPEMKGFKLAKKPLPSEFTISDEIRRAPQTKPSFAAASQSFLNTVNNGPVEPVAEDELCPSGSSSIWIAVENSDLPRIGKFITRPASSPIECIDRCEKMNIDGQQCNQFVFYETSKQCAYGHETDMFGVKPSKTADFSTRAYKKLCYPDTISAFNDCSDFLAFRDYKLNLEPKEVFDGLPSGHEGVSSCVELCVLSNGFKCRSASFDFADGKCSLFSEYSLSAPNEFKEHLSDSLLFFENGCIADSVEEQSAILEAEAANVPFDSLRVQKVNSAPSSESLSHNSNEPKVIDFRKLKY